MAASIGLFTGCKQNFKTDQFEAARVTVVNNQTKVWVDGIITVNCANNQICIVTKHNSGEYKTSYIAFPDTAVWCYEQLNPYQLSTNNPQVNTNQN